MVLCLFCWTMYYEGLTQWGTSSTQSLHLAFHLERQSSVLPDGRRRNNTITAPYIDVYYLLSLKMKWYFLSVTYFMPEDWRTKVTVHVRWVYGWKQSKALFLHFLPLIADKQPHWSTAATTKWRSVHTLCSAYFSGLGGENLKWPYWSPEAALCISVESSNEWQRIAFGRPH